MASDGRPRPFSVIGGADNSESWKRWRAAWADYAIDVDLYKQPPIKQMVRFRTVFGEDNRESVENLEIAAVPNDKPDEDGLEPCIQLKNTLNALEKRFTTHKNVLYQRYLLFRTNQSSGETIKDFYSRVSQQVKRCGFGEYGKTFLRDILVLGTRLSLARESLFRLEDKDLTLDNVIRTLELHESNEQSLNAIENDRQRSERVNAVSYFNNRYQGASGSNNGSHTKAPHKYGQVTRERSYINQQQRQTNRKFSQSKQHICRSCGRKQHLTGNQCPAYGLVCDNCGQENHYARVCPRRNKERVNVCEQDEEHEEENPVVNESLDLDDTFVCDSVGRVPKRKLYATVRLNNGAILRPLLDTGATTCVISKNVLQSVEVNKKKYDINVHDKVLLRMFDDNRVSTLGSVWLTCSVGNQSQKLRFQVVNQDLETLLSAKACVDLKLITLSKHVEFVSTVIGEDKNRLESLVDEFNDIFEGLGKMPQPVKIKIKPNSIPVQQAKRQTPVALTEKIRERIKELESAGIIEKVEYPTEWVSNMVPVDRPGKKLRICIDPHHLNKVIERPRYPMPTLADCLHKLSKAKVFSVLDARDGYYQLELDSDSADLTTFWCPDGRYRYLRLPQGISSAPEQFQMRQAQAYDGLKGVIVIADDTLCYGEGESIEEAIRDHASNLRALFERARRIGLKYNRGKMRLCLDQVRFMGHIISSEGLKVDPDKIAAILKMPAPKDIKSVQCFLGCVTYLLPFLPNLAQLTEPLRRLTQSGVEFSWLSQQEKAFTAIKEKLTEAPTLAYFDSNEPITLQCDASSFALGGLLIQHNKPVAFTSHSLNKTEQAYATIEKEMLAIVITCRKFDPYLYAAKHVILVETDHAPLVQIFNKPLDDCPKRLQRMLLALQRYNLRLQYIRGKNNIIADLLSRNPLPESANNKSTQESVLLSELQEITPRIFNKISDPLLAGIKQETMSDSKMRELITTIQEGWPEKAKNVEGTLLPYFTFRHELSVHDGIVYKGVATVIPERMRADMIRRAHKCHLGYDAMCRRVRNTVFWPNIKNDLHNISSSCTACQTFQIAQRREPLMQKPVPQRPWQVIHQDLFSWEGEQYLVTVDSFSNYFELDHLGTTTTTHAIIKKTAAHFARHGRPCEMHTDSDPRYVASAFQSFLNTWQVQHVTSSPHNHQSNGMSEAGVKIAKRIIKKCLYNKENIDMALLEWRNTPQSDGLSPAEKLFSRRLSSIMPEMPKQLLTKHSKHVSQHKWKQQEIQKKCYDKGSQLLHPLRVGQVVRVQPTKIGVHRWDTGTIVKELSPRTYLVRTSNGNTLVRNRRFLSPVHNISNNLFYSSSNDFQGAPLIKANHCVDVANNNNNKSSVETTPQQMSLPPVDPNRDRGSLSSTNIDNIQRECTPRTQQQRSQQQQHQPAQAVDTATASTDSNNRDRSDVEAPAAAAQDHDNSILNGRREIKLRLLRKRKATPTTTRDVSSVKRQVSEKDNNYTTRSGRVVKPSTKILEQSTMDIDY